MLLSSSVFQPPLGSYCPLFSNVHSCRFECVHDSYSVIFQELLCAACTVEGSCDITTWYTSPELHIPTVYSSYPNQHNTT